MVYVALLRGINVGGKNTVSMDRLKEVFEGLGFMDVRTYINSGNVIFTADRQDVWQLAGRIEQAVVKDFGFSVAVLVRDFPSMEKLVKGLPDDWMNDEKTKCDVMFLWGEVDDPAVLEKIPHDSQLEDLIYLPGAVVWRIDRDKVAKSRVLRINGTDLYRQMTVRNPNTVRKLYELMVEVG